MKTISLFLSLLFSGTLLSQTITLKVSNPDNQKVVVRLVKTFEFNNQNFSGNNVYSDEKRMIDGEIIKYEIPENSSYVLWFDGKVFYDLVYFVKNSSKEPLEITAAILKDHSEKRKYDIKLAFNDTNHILVRMNKILIEDYSLRINLIQKMRENNTLFDSIQFSTHQLYLLSQMRNESIPFLLRQLNAVLLAQPISISKMLKEIHPNREEILNLCPPNSELWTLVGPQSFDWICHTEKGMYEEAITRQFINENPDSSIRAFALGRLINKYEKEGSQFEAAKLKTELNDKYSSVKMAFMMLQSETKKNDEKRSGKPVEFSFKLIDNGKTITEKDLTGNYYLIDFWGIWCSGCVRELPNLTELYKKYNVKGFKIISIAIDTEENVNKFRKTKFKMDWDNVVLSTDQGNEVTRKFDINYFPNPILVDPNGIIINAGYNSLTGEKLQKKLKEIYGF